MGKRKVGALEKVDADLPNLQHKIKRDPSSYEADFESQYRQYQSHLDIFLAAPQSASNSSTGIVSLRDLIDFISHVADCYLDITKSFPQELIDLLSTHHEILDAELREKVVGALVLLRRKEVVNSTTLLQTFFPILISTSSKSLRAILFQKIISDLRTSNAKTTNHKLNRTIQTVLQNLLTSDKSSSKGLWAVKITRELWKRQIWTDAKAVEIMKEAALAENEKVIVGGVRFFLGGDKEREEAEEEESSEDEAVDVGKIRHQMGITGKTKKKAKALNKAAATVKKKEKKKNAPHPLNFSALHLLHDPQGFAETLFTKHLQNSRSKLNLEHKLLVLQLVSRLVGLHKLTVISLYSYFLKYLTPRQPSVTSFLASLAQSTHNLVPPDVLEPLVQKIANEFVSEAAASEVASAGLNAIREICVRQPLAMNDTLLQDLVMYRKSKDKGVVMAAKGLLSLYREVGADMLKKRDRGKEASMAVGKGERKEKRFGEAEIGEIEGIELLEAWKENERRKKREEKGLDPDDTQDDEDDEEEEDWGAWDVEDDYSDDSGGWINVESDDEINISSDDDDEKKPPSKKVKFDIPDVPHSNDENLPPSQDTPTNPTDSKSKPSLATTRILTPADLSKLAELRASNAISTLIPTGTHQKHHQRPSTQPKSTHHPDDAVTADDLTGLAALSAAKATRLERIAHAREGKDDREAFKGKEAKRKERKMEQGKSTTNREKARQKNFLMTMGKRKKDGRAGLAGQSKALKARAKTQQRGKGGGRK